MVPLIDTHCHLLAGLDDGPRTWDESLAMCQLAWDDGVRAIAATAHQNEDYPLVTPERIREATVELAARLHEADIPLAVYPCAEVMVTDDLERAWQAAGLLSVADGGRYLLIELPHGLFLDLRDLVDHLASRGTRVILAHPERHGELLHSDRAVEELIDRGCLIQVSARSVIEKEGSAMASRLREWARRGVIHLVGSDGHSLRRRPPGLSRAYQRLASWAGYAFADRVCSTNGMAVLEGLSIRTTRPVPIRKGWLSRLGW